MCKNDRNSTQLNVKQTLQASVPADATLQGRETNGGMNASIVRRGKKFDVEEKHERKIHCESKLFLSYKTN